MRLILSTRHIALLFSLLGLGANALSAESVRAEAQRRYLADRAACVAPGATQERSSCFKEASSALAEVLAGKVEDPHADFVANASKRCAPLPPADAVACRARMQGQGTQSGSVGSGGIYRELVTRVPAPQPAAAEASAPR